MIALPPARLTVFMLLMAAVLGIGCGPKPVQKFKVSGSVSLDGDPIEEGTLIFFPADDSGADADVASIKAGRYELLSKPGPKRVEITAQREMPDKVGPYGDPEMEQYIPKAFNRESKLEAEVAEAEMNSIDFELETPAE